jgi:uncharacterized protein YndB with AHSA1/START domain
MTNGTLLTEGIRPAVRLERHLPDPPSVIWQAITDREQLQTWFPCDVAVAGGRWEPGASITFVFPADVADMTITGEVLTVDEPKTLAYTWGEEVLRFELHPEDGGTRLVLIDELPAGSAARNAAGWEVCLDRLAGKQPGNQPRDDAWRPLFETYKAAFEPTLGPQEGPPPEYRGE